MSCMHINVLLGRDSLYCCDCLAKVKEARFRFHTQAQYEASSSPSTQPTGIAPPAANSDREWWRAQDADTAWARQWEGDTDRTNPKIYK